MNPSKSSGFSCIKNGRGYQTRTDGLTLPKRARYQLRQTPNSCYYTTLFVLMQKLTLNMRYNNRYEKDFGYRRYWLYWLSYCR